MLRFSKTYATCLVFLLSAFFVQVHCSVGEENQPQTKNISFMSDAAQMEMLMATLNLMNKRLRTIEENQTSHASSLAVKIEQLVEGIKQPLSEQGPINKLDAFEQHQDAKILEVLEQQHSLNQKIEILIKSHGAEALKFPKEFNELTQTLSDTKAQCERNFDLLPTKADLRTYFRKATKKILSKFEEKLAAFQREEQEKLALILSKTSDLNKNFKASNIQCSASLETLQNLSSSLKQSLEAEKNQTKILENLIGRISANNATTPFPPPSRLYASCEEAVKEGGESGVYLIRRPNTNITMFRAFCMKDPKGGMAWTVMQRRQQNSSHFLDFQRGWEEYKYGFGDPEHDYWLGLENIFALTNSTRHELWLHYVNEEQETRDTIFSDFKIANEKGEYAIVSLRLRPSMTNGCPNYPYNTIDRTNSPVYSKEMYGGVGRWAGCEAWNAQRELDEGGLELDYSTHTTYIHVAIRPSDS